MQAENELAKCPFCGNTRKEEFAIHITDMSIGDTAFNRINVCCSCGARGPDGETKEEAIAAWNRRRGGENK
jgi:Lar family restriction alleviation protein